VVAPSGPARLAARRVDTVLTAFDSAGALLIAGLFAACVLLVLSFVPWEQNSDDLLPAIMSLQKITLYYWEQNRFGNLLPALVAWIANPTQNAYAQIVLRVVAGMVAPVFFTAMMFHRSSDVWRAALAADCLILLAASPSLLHETFIVATPYGTSLACGGLGILAVRRAAHVSEQWHRGALMMIGALALLAACIVNYALAMVAIPMLAILAVLLPSVTRTQLLVMACGAAFIALLLPVAFAPQYPTSLALRLSWDALGLYLAAIWTCAGWNFLLAVGVPLALVSLLYRYGSVRRSGKPFVVLLLASVVTAVVTFVIAASSEHVMLNSYNPRYFVPSFLMFLALGGLGIWQSLRLIMPTRLVREATFVMLAVLMLMGAHGRLAASGGTTNDIIGWGRADMARTVAARYVALSLDGIAGSYWDVWPSVFAAEQYHNDSGWSGPDVLGVTQRGGARRDVFIARLLSRGRLRLACIDLAPEGCLTATDEAMKVPGLQMRAFGAAEPIGEGHTLYYIEILPRGSAAAK
jgi:hypothetical protein